MRGTESLVRQQAAHSLRENLEVVGEATKDAEKIIDLGNVLTAGNDPAKQRLGAMLKDYATEGMNQVLSGQLPKEVMAIEAQHPFSENSGRSGASLPGTPKSLPTPTPSPSTTPQPPQPATGKRGRGRPRKSPPQ